MARRGYGHHDDATSEVERLRRDNAMLCERLDVSARALEAAEAQNKRLIARQSASHSQLVRDLAEAQARLQVQREMLRDSEEKIKGGEEALREAEDRHSHTILRMETVYQAKRAEFLDAERAVTELREQVNHLNYKANSARAREDEANVALAATTRERDELTELCADLSEAKTALEQQVTILTKAGNDAAAEAQSRKEKVAELLTRVGSLEATLAKTKADAADTLAKEKRSASQRYGDMKSVAESRIAALEESLADAHEDQKRLRSECTRLSETVLSYAGTPKQQEQLAQLKAKLTETQKALETATRERDEARVELRISEAKATTSLQAQVSAETVVAPLQRELQEAKSMLAETERQLAAAQEQVAALSKQVADAEVSQREAVEAAVKESQEEQRRHWKRMRAEWDEVTHKEVEAAVSKVRDAKDAELAALRQRYDGAVESAKKEVAHSSDQTTALLLAEFAANHEAALERERAEFAEKLQAAVSHRETALLNSERAYKAERQQLETALKRRVTTLRRRIAMQLLDHVTRMWAVRAQSRAMRRWFAGVQHQADVLSRLKWRRSDTVRAKRRRRTLATVFRAWTRFVHDTRAVPSLFDCRGVVVLRGVVPPCWCRQPHRRPTSPRAPAASGHRHGLAPTPATRQSRRPPARVPLSHRPTRPVSPNSRSPRSGGPGTPPNAHDSHPWRRLFAVLGCHDVAVLDLMRDTLAATRAGRAAGSGSGGVARVRSRRTPGSGGRERDGTARRPPRGRTGVLSSGRGGSGGRGGFDHSNGSASGQAAAGALSALDVSAISRSSSLRSPAAAASSNLGSPGTVPSPFSAGCGQPLVLQPEPVLVVTTLDKCTAATRFATLLAQLARRRMRSAWSVWTGAAQTAASVTSLHLEKALADSVAQVAGLRAESDALRAELRSSKRRVVGLQRQLLKPFVFGDTAGAGPPPPPQGVTGGPEAAPPVTTRQWVQPAAVPQLDARAS